MIDGPRGRRVDCLRGPEQQIVAPIQRPVEQVFVKRLKRLGEILASKLFQFSKILAAKHVRERLNSRGIGLLRCRRQADQHQISMYRCVLCLDWSVPCKP